MKTDEAEAIKTQHKKPKERHKTKKKKKSVEKIFSQILSL